MPDDPRPFHRLIAFYSACALALVPCVTRAQAHPPRICSPSDAIDLVSTSRSSAVDIAISGVLPATMWLLYSKEDGAGQETAYLMEVSDVGGSDLTIRGNRALGPGTVMQGGLAIVGSNVVSVFLRPDRRIGVSTRAIAGGAAPTNLTLEGGDSPFSLSVAAVGERALVAWDDPNDGIRDAWLDDAGTRPGPVEIVRGHFGAAVASGAFGGTLIFADALGADAHLSLAAATPSSHAQIARATAANTAVSALASSDTPHGAAVTYTTSDGVHLATFDAVTGAGRDRMLGGANVATETVVASAPWGVFTAWTLENNMRVLPLAHDGSETTGQFTVRGASGSERMRLPAMAAFGSTAVLVWNASNLAPRPDGATTAVRMVRVECR
jgi:hypothetical protein